MSFKKVKFDGGVISVLDNEVHVMIECRDKHTNYSCAYFSLPARVWFYIKKYRGVEWGHSRTIYYDLLVTDPKRLRFFVTETYPVDSGHYSHDLASGEIDADVSGALAIARTIVDAAVGGDTGQLRGLVEKLAENLDAIYCSRYTVWWP
ncbi:MAG: hypothetical protein QW453_06330 [Thermoprotei archaeon]